MTDNSFKVINAETIQSIISGNIHCVYETVKKTYLAHGKRDTVNPSSYFLRFPDDPNSRIIALPAALSKQDPVAGIKWIGSNPNNIGTGLDRASAVIILNDYISKYPFACLEGSIISATRTACSAVLGAEYLLKQKNAIKCLGIIGCGPIAGNIIKIFKSMGWSIGHFIFYDINNDRIRQFISQYLDPEDHYHIAQSDSQAIKQSDVLVFATSSIVPYIKDPALFVHCPVVLHISLRDLSPEILLKANNIADDIDHVLNANTSVHLAYQAQNDKGFINGTIVDLINNTAKLDDTKPSIYSPMGLGVLDIALAYYIYKEALKTQSFTDIKRFFPYSNTKENNNARDPK